MQDAIIARFHYFQSTMLPASMQLNESVLTFSTPKAEKDLVIVRPRQLKVTCSTHLNSGHDTETASQMMTVIESSGEFLVSG